VSLLRIKDRISYGWVVLVTYLIIGTCIMGIRFSFGVFFKSIGGEFDLTRTTTSGIFSLYLVLSAACGVLGGWALDRYGPRAVTFLMGLFTGSSLILTSLTNSAWQLFLSYSLLLAIGTGATYVVMTSTALRWFEKRRGLAMGIASTSNGLGMLSLSPFAAYLISGFGWHTAFITIGLLSWLIVLPLSMLLKRDPSQIGLAAEGTARDAGRIEMQTREVGIHSAGLSLPEASRTRSFWLILAAWLLFASSFFLVMTHAVPHATDMGLSAIKAAVVISLMGGASIIGMLLGGRLSDSIGRKVPAVGCAIIEGGALIWLIWSHDLWMFYVFAVAFGFAYGGIVPAMTAMIGDTFGPKNIGTIMGVLAAGFQFGAGIGPVIGGLAFDLNGNYSLAFLVAALSMSAVALLLALIRPETDL
jgi:MFS family permease